MDGSSWCRRLDVEIEWYRGDEGGKDEEMVGQFVCDLKYVLIYF